MGKKVNKFLKGQIATTIFYIVFGLCLVLMPVKTVDVLCKVVFGLVLIGSGLYHIYVFVREKENTTILDLFSGVLVLVIGGFLFTNPQVVIKLLPVMLGAFVLVDSIWTMRGGLKLRKRRLPSWKAFGVESLIFIALGVFLIAYPFQSVNVMLMFAGWIFLCNGVLDVVLYIILQKGLKKEITAEESGEEKAEAPAGEETAARTGKLEKAAKRWKKEKAETAEKEDTSGTAERTEKEETAAKADTVETAETAEKAAETAAGAAVNEEKTPGEPEPAEAPSEPEEPEEAAKEDTDQPGGEEAAPEAAEEVLEEWKD